MVMMDATDGIFLYINQPPLAAATSFPLLMNHSRHSSELGFRVHSLFSTQLIMAQCSLAERNLTRCLLCPRSPSAINIMRRHSCIFSHKIRAHYPHLQIISRHKQTKLTTSAHDANKFSNDQVDKEVKIINYNIQMSCQLFPITLKRGPGGAGVGEEVNKYEADNMSCFKISAFALELRASVE